MGRALSNIKKGHRNRFKPDGNGMVDPSMLDDSFEDTGSSELIQDLQTKQVELESKLKDQEKSLQEMLQAVENLQEAARTAATDLEEVNTAMAMDMVFDDCLEGGSDDFTFWPELEGDVVTISAGTIRFMGPSDANYLVPIGSVTLTGTPEYVYLWHKKDHSASGFSHSSTEPLSNGDEWRWPLAVYTASSGVYSLYGPRLYPGGDINALLPLK